MSVLSQQLFDNYDVLDLNLLGIIYENENEADGMQRVLETLHEKYVPFSDVLGQERTYSQQGFAADQLSVERGVNCLLQLQNGFTPKERLEDIHFEIADFHGGMKFLQYGFDHFYDANAPGDKCTLHSDRVLINRRNVRTDVSKKVDACKQFFELEVKSRIIAATLKTLDLKSIADVPRTDLFPDTLLNASDVDKRKFLNNLTAKVVDTYIIRNDIEQIFKKQNYEDWLRTCNPKTLDGRFKCRLLSCTKTFRYDGKRRIEHEKSHGFHDIADSLDKSDKVKQDDMFSYQCALLEYGCILLNFYDAVSEGDDMRVIRGWKFMLPYLKQDGASSRKYALEALYLLFQVYAMLSPRDSHRLIWNRFHKPKFGLGGNIPLDLAMEHYNNFIKNLMRKLGPNATNRTALDQLTKALTCNKKLLDNYDTMCSVIKLSGRHVQRSKENDIRKVVAELLKQNAFTTTPGRAYKSFKDFKSSLVEDFDIHAMYLWIEEHKKKIYLQKAAR